MPDSTPNLSLPLILPSQAQKHVTHNEALRVIDLLCQLSAVSASVAAPPVETVEGRRYIIPTGATGAWSGKATQVAVWGAAGWTYLVPKTGWIGWVESPGEMRMFDGTAWVTPTVSIPSEMPLWGVNTTADTTNRLSVQSPASLFTHDGSGHQIKVNKAGISDTASLLFQTNWSGRAEMGLAGTDSFSIKVSANGAAFQTALTAAPATGAVTFPEPVALPQRTTAAAVPATGTLSLYAAARGGTGWIEAARPAGRPFAMQPSLALNRITQWAPSTGTVLNTFGIPRAGVGTVSHPTLTTGALVNSTRRWRNTSAATANSPADERTGIHVCWRGNAAGLGGFTFVDRVNIATMVPTAVGFFGLMNATAALAGTTTLSALGACIGIGFDRAVDTTWQLLYRDGTAALTKVNLGNAFSVDSTTNIYTLMMFAPPNGSSILIEVVEEVSGTRVQQEPTTNIPTNTQFLSPRHFMTNLATASAVAYECSGLYIETDF